MSVEARYAGQCPDCEGWWQPGDLIRTRGTSAWRHAVCPGQPDPLATTSPVCQACWLPHPEGACDRD